MDSYISDAVIRRLPRYRRYLKKLSGQGIQRISSKELGSIMDVTASQIRQDLNHFGGFGQQGYGYGVEDLSQKLEEIMGLDRTYNIGVVGCGRLGQAIISYLANNEPFYKLCGAGYCGTLWRERADSMRGMETASLTRTVLPESSR